MTTDDQGPKLTRRAFLGLPPEDLTNNKGEKSEGQSTQKTQNKRRSSQKSKSFQRRVSKRLSILSRSIERLIVRMRHEWATNLSRISSTGITLGVVIVLLVLAPLSVPASATMDASTGEDVQSNEAIEAQEQALTLLNELESLDSKPGADVSTTVIGAINDDLAQGNASYRENDFAQAKQHYDEAARKAQDALTQAYIDRSELLLNSSSSYLQDLRDGGYQTSDMSVLSERVDRLQSRSQSVESLRDARELHTDAEALKEDIESDTPSTQTVAVVNSLLGIWGVVLIVVLSASVFGIGGATGAVVDRRLRDSDDGDDENRTRRAVTGASNSRGHNRPSRDTRVQNKD